MLWIHLLLLLQGTPGHEFEAERLQSLRATRRVYVDKLTGESAEQIRDLLMTALQASNVFVITEDPERADAFLRGTASDLIYTDRFQSSDGVDARTSLNLNNSSGSGSTARRRGNSVSGGAGDRESISITERKHEAIASLRLVNRQGDLIWSTTQESRGVKFKGASADVADKVARKLLEDFAKAKPAAPVTP